MSYAIAILGLLGLVFIHELGHFSAAKAVGMRALRFSIGFPPIVAGRQIGDTEYTIGAIPLGGYVKIPGMLRPEPDDLYAVEDALDRNESIPAEHTAAIGEAVDITRGHLTRGRWDEARDSLEPLRAAVAASAELTPLERRRIERGINRVGEGLDPRAYWRSSRRARLIVIVAGPAANAVAAFLILVGLFMSGVPNAVTNHVDAVTAGSPAARAGLQPGDRLVDVNGHPVGPEAARLVIIHSHGKPIQLTVRRANRLIELQPVRPQIMVDSQYHLGFQFGVATRSYSLAAAPGMALSSMWTVTTGTLGALSDRFSSGGQQQLHSVVGIVRYSAEAERSSAPSYVGLLAVISLSLAIFNLLPFLPLDGGHVLMIVIERLRGRMVSRAVFERVSVVGIALMAVLFMIGLQNDLGANLFGQPH